MRLISWNVNGIRAVMKKDFMNVFSEIGADVFCIQETKAQNNQVMEALEPVNGYYKYVNSAVRKGYSGTTILSKEQPAKVTCDLGAVRHDQEGRVITAEYEKFSLVNVYVPNSGEELTRLDYREQWDADFLNYLKSVEKNKPVIVCGDMNVAHRPIDLARPKSNYNKTAGYTQREIDGMDSIQNAGFIDTFRKLHPDETAYSWWSYRFNSRAKNIGWRIDYFLISPSLTDRLKEAFILQDVSGSDHCPVGVDLFL
ncbi:MAG: exodeoxyribonuclease III [Bacteroidetes bacterium]|nr:exodeoxyribonuclease III [Bacteroidota bacterium]